MRKYETVAGVVTRGETFAKLIETLTEAQELCYVLAHLHATEDGHNDALLAQGWRATGEMMKLTKHNITKMAMNKRQ